MSGEIVASVSCTECSKPIVSQDYFVKKLRKIFCSECWVFHCNFRFRKRIFELGKPNKGSNANLLLAPTETVMIYYDGSPSSVALINLIRDAAYASSVSKDNIPQRNLPFPFNFVLFVILESDDIGGSGSEGRQKKHLTELQNWLQSSEQTHNIIIPLYASSIEVCFKGIQDISKEIKQIVGRDVTIQDSQMEKKSEDTVIEKTLLENLRLPFDQNLNSQLNSILANLKTKTSLKDLVNILKHNLTVSVARSMHISKIILPEDQSNLAIKMFTIMSLGRGAQLAEQMGFTTVISREGGVVTFARPLMDFLSDDLRQYLQCLPQENSQGLFSGGSPTKSRKMKIDSLERQCDNFIVELQSGFASTVPTLAKIGEKLCPSVSRSSLLETGGRQCKLCKRPEEESDQDDLCYGCSNIFKDMKEPGLLRKLIENEDVI